MRAPPEPTIGDKRPLFPARQLRGPGQLLANDHAHTAAEEAEIEDQQRNRIAVERRLAVSGGIAAAELGLGLAKLVPVRLGVGEEQRIGGRERAVELDEAAAIDERRDPAVDVDREMVLTFVANAESFIERTPKQGRPAFWAVCQRGRVWHARFTPSCCRDGTKGPLIMVVRAGLGCTIRVSPKSQMCAGGAQDCEGFSWVQISSRKASGSMSCDASRNRR